MIKKILGIAPQPTHDGAYSPSRLSLSLAVPSITDYDSSVYENRQLDGRYKILMICTEEQNLLMKNGTYFSTGNHPVEMLVPMLHFNNAGFEVDIFTPTGKPVKIEMWAMPIKDMAVTNIYATYKNRFEKPRSLSDFVANAMANSDEYIAAFIPGGHGALLGLPQNMSLGQLIYWLKEKDLFMLSICHGPAAFLAAHLVNKEAFIYRGYKIAAFPDRVDKITPLIGYMPGQLTWKYGEELQKLGVEIVNQKADKTCYVDRKLITGASPKAANEFGKLTATKILETLKR